MKVSRLFIGFAITFLAAWSSGALADDWGCQVLLCLSNPAGPKAASGCEPPIDRLYSALSKRPPEPFPQCSTSNGSRAGVRYESLYDACPNATTALRAGVRAAQWVTTNDGQYLALSTGIGDLTVATDAEAPKVCVGNRLGETYLDDDRTTKVDVYDRIVTIQSHTQMVFDVYVANQLFRTVRP